jgi:hypothetical protein
VQQHLLAVKPANLHAAIEAAEDFFRLGETPTRISSIEPEQASERKNQLTQLLGTMQAMMAQQTELLTKICQQPATTPQPTKRQPIKCFLCEGPHLKRNCPKNTPISLAGNEKGPASP